MLKQLANSNNGLFHLVHGPRQLAFLIFLDVSTGRFNDLIFFLRRCLLVVELPLVHKAMNLRVDDIAILLLHDLIEILLEILNKLWTLADVFDVIGVYGLRHVGGFALGVFGMEKAF